MVPALLKSAARSSPRSPGHPSMAAISLDIHVVDIIEGGTPFPRLHECDWRVVITCATHSKSTESRTHSGWHQLIQMHIFEELFISVDMWCRSQKLKHSNQQASNQCARQGSK